MLEKLKQINRGLLELSVGILFLGIICLLAGVIFVEEPAAYGIALILGVLLALITVYHMYRTLDKALTPGVDATKVATAANLIRYVCIVIVFGLVWMTGKLNPLFTFLGLMTLKAAAYMQPLTHKVCNKIFHEVDPIPMPEALPIAEPEASLDAAPEASPMAESETSPKDETQVMPEAEEIVDNK